MSEVPKIEVGDMVRLKTPDIKAFDGAVLTVEEVRTWGVVGYARLPGELDAYFRATFDEIEGIWRKAS